MRACVCGGGHNIRTGKFMQRGRVGGASPKTWANFLKPMRFSLDTGFHNFGFKVLVSSKPVIKSWRTECI